MRYVTFTFDDGLINTARIVQNLNIPITFYIVLGWVLKKIDIDDLFNSNLDHGTIEEWKKLEFDIGCHTYNHSKFFNEEFSFKQFSKIFDGIKNFATPYSIEHSTVFYDSCKIGFFNNPYNSFTKTNIKRICSINPKYDIANKNILEELIKNCPNDNWMVFTFHGINEGWYPIEYDELVFWRDFLCYNNFKFISITEGVKNTCRRYLP